MKNTIIVFLLIFVSCGGNISDTNSSIAVFDDVLYKALLNYDIGSEVMEGKFLLLESSVYFPSTRRCDQIRASKKSIGKNNSVKSELIDKLLIDKKDEMVFSNLSIGKIKLQGTVLESDYEIAGAIKASRVFFSDIDSHQGLFYYEFICGGECGSGNLVFIQLIDGRWEINKQVPIFVM